MTLAEPKATVLPQLGDGYTTTSVNGVHTASHLHHGRASIAVGAPIAEARREINQLHLRVLLICGGFIVGTFIVGWLMWSS